MTGDVRPSFGGLADRAVSLPSPARAVCCGGATCDDEARPLMGDRFASMLGACLREIRRQPQRTWQRKLGQEKMSSLSITFHKCDSDGYWALVMLKRQAARAAELELSSVACWSRWPCAVCQLARTVFVCPRKPRTGAAQARRQQLGLKMSVTPSQGLLLHATYTGFEG